MLILLALGLLILAATRVEAAPTASTEAEGSGTRRTHRTEDDQRDDPSRRGDDETDVEREYDCDHSPDTDERDDAFGYLGDFDLDRDDDDDDDEALDDEALDDEPGDSFVDVPGDSGSDNGVALRDPDTVAETLDTGDAVSFDDPSVRDAIETGHAFTSTAFADAAELGDLDLRHQRPSRWGRLDLSVAWRRVWTPPPVTISLGPLPHGPLAQNLRHRRLVVAPRHLESMTSTSLPVLESMMRTSLWFSTFPIPRPTPLLLGLVALAFVSCELAHGLASPCAEARPTPARTFVWRGREPANNPDATADLSDEQGSGGGQAVGPAIGEVLKAAYRAAGLDRDPARGWIRRARLAGLIPWLTVRTGRDASWQSDEVSVDHGLALDIRATWRLDRLAFDGRELQVASIEAARRRERRRLASRVIRVYFAWQRAAGPGAPESYDGGYRPGARARALEAAAALDALTDGWFSKSLVGSRRSASDGRTP